jgi:hypothetical protein
MYDASKVLKNDVRSGRRGYVRWAVISPCTAVKRHREPDRLGLSEDQIIECGVDGRKQLRHTDARTTLNSIHLRGGITEQAMADVSNSVKLDAGGRKQWKGSQYIQ